VIEEFAFAVENPPLPGEQITTRSGTAIVTRLERLGKEMIVWGDYGSGIEQPHGRENATCDLKIVLGGKVVEPVAIAESLLAIDPLAPKFESKACGWIGKKTTERKRKNRDAWVCVQWWLYWEEPGGKKRSRYVPKAKLAEVEYGVYELKQPIAKTLELLHKKG
jgi:hypothetical protein